MWWEERAGRGERPPLVDRAHRTRLEERWQRRLDGGEQVFCSRCRLRGTMTPLDRTGWRLDVATRRPVCPGCHRELAAA